MHTDWIFKILVCFLTFASAADAAFDRPLLKAARLRVFNKMIHELVSPYPLAAHNSARDALDIAMQSLLRPTEAEIKILGEKIGPVLIRNQPFSRLYVRGSEHWRESMENEKSRDWWLQVFESRTIQLSAEQIEQLKSGQAPEDLLPLWFAMADSVRATCHWIHEIYDAMTTVDRRISHHVAQAAYEYTLKYVLRIPHASFYAIMPSLREALLPEYRSLAFAEYLRRVPYANLAVSKDIEQGRGNELLVEFFSLWFEQGGDWRPTYPQLRLPPEGKETSSIPKDFQSLFGRLALLRQQHTSVAKVYIQTAKEWGLGHKDVFDLYLQILERLSRVDLMGRFVNTFNKWNESAEDQLLSILESWSVLVVASYFEKLLSIEQVQDLFLRLRNLGEQYLGTKTIEAPPSASGEFATKMTESLFKAFGVDGLLTDQKTEEVLEPEWVQRQLRGFRMVELASWGNHLIAATDTDMSVPKCYAYLVRLPQNSLWRPFVEKTNPPGR